MSTWNEKCRDANYIERLKGRDPKAFLPDSYLFLGSQLKPETSCALGSCCILGPKVGKGEIAEEEDSEGNHAANPLVYSWVFCFSCDNIFHLHCQGFKTNEFKALELKNPFRCKLCLEEPNNPMALEFYRIQDDIDLRISRRRDTFMKVIDLSRSTIHDDSIISNSNYEIENLRSDFEKQLERMTLRSESAEIQRDEVMATLIECKREISELRKFKEEFEAIKAQIQVTSSMSKDRMEASSSSTIPKLKPTPKRNVRASISPVISIKNNDEDIQAEKYLREPSTAYSRNSKRVNAGAVPMPKPRKSLIDDIDVDKLSQSDRITLEQAQAQMDATQAQIEIASSQNLAVIRKALPKITRFDGDARKWVQFKRDVDRYQTVGRYDEYEMRIHVLQALEGLALSRVQGSIDKVQFSTTMNALQKCFGEPTRIIEQCAKDILALKIPKYLCKDDVLLITSKIQEYFAACYYAQVECANSNQLATHIFDQLSLLHKQLFRQKFRTSTNAHSFRLIELDILFEFLEDLADDLEDKKLDDMKSKPIQINMHAMTEKSSDSVVSSSSSDDFMFEIKDKKESSLGYDLEELKSFNQFCDCCSTSGHYTVQCEKYKVMSPDERLRFVNSKYICRNCIITSTHRSFDCRLKENCGFKERNETCSRRHHISLHRAFDTNESSSYYNKNRNYGSGNGNGGSGNGSQGRTFRRNNSNFNQRKAENIIKDCERETEKEVESDESDMQLGQTVYANTANCYGSTALCKTLDIKRTVKVFKNKFIGTKGEVVGYSVCDSAAEVTFLRDELREYLGLKGDKCELVLQLTDGSLKTVKAMRVDLVVRGMAKNCRELILKNCYAVPDLNLPYRSLDMDKLKSQSPYLSEIEFAGYTNVSPCLVIGSSHASMFECDANILEGGKEKLVGLRTKLGWTVYGGCIKESSVIPYCIKSVNECKWPGMQQIHEPPMVSESVKDNNENLCDALSKTVLMKETVINNLNLLEKIVKIVMNELISWLDKNHWRNEKNYAKRKRCLKKDCSMYNIKLKYLQT